MPSHLDINTARLPRGVIPLDVLGNAHADKLCLGKNLPGPIWGHLKLFFPWTGKIQKHVKMLPIFLAGPMGAIHPDWALLLSTRGGEIDTFESY